LKLGIFGGTFNPPHIGHMILAETAADALNLDRVYFVPAADPPHKVGMPRASVEHRVQMVTRAIADNPRFELSRVDIDRPGPHYAADMVGIFQQENPGAELFFLMGSDSLRDLLEWVRPAELVAACNIVVMSRPVVPPDMDALNTELPLLKEHLILIGSPEIEISSTNIIARIQKGQSVRYRLQEDIREYIDEHGLYQD
jgi:nicotinate-nucleotide adenylyltransferase